MIGGAFETIMVELSEIEAELATVKGTAWSTPLEQGRIIDQAPMDGGDTEEENEVQERMRHPEVIRAENTDRVMRHFSKATC